MNDHNEGHAENCACLYPGDRECNCHKARGFPTAEAMEVADRLESATTPAEVGEVEVLAERLERLSHHHRVRDIEFGQSATDCVSAANTIRTLARQLAEAKALLAGPLPTDHETYPVLSSDHRAAKARCASKRGTSEDAQAMRLCAEACSAYSLKLAEIGGNYARALHRIAELEQAESQLAEATRRLREVEGLVGKWRECAEDNAARGELIQAGKAVAYTDCATQLEAALTKEPTK